MSGPYGVLPGGFVIKPLDAIIADIEADLRENLDPAIDTSPTGVLGQDIAIRAAALYEVWGLAQSAYDAGNPDKAVGQSQDSIGAIRGSKRLTAKASAVLCNLVFGSPGTYYAGTLVANVVGQPAAQFSNGLDIVVPALDGAGNLTVFPFSVPGAIFKALAVGPTAAASGTLTVITAPVTGWTSIVNGLDATLGMLVETDPDYRLRQELELELAGACTSPSLESDLFELGATSAKVLENPGDTVDLVTGMPGHSSHAIVYDAPDPLADEDIGAVVLANKPSGAQTFGNTSVQILDPLGVTQTVFFSRPTELPVWLAFTIKLAPGAVLGTVTTALQTLIVNLSKGRDANGDPLPFGTPGTLLPGGAVESLIYASAARLQVPGVARVVSLALDFTASPSATADLSVGQLAVATLDSSRISVASV